MADMTVANTIAQQLGGTGRLKAMLGVKSFAGSSNSLSFMFSCRAKNSINAITITLNEDDLYDIDFFRIRGSKHTIVDQGQGVDCESLKRYIEQSIGLYLSF